MANIMSMVKLNNKTSRNAFDLSRRNAFTAKVGELLPVACIECIPGDNVKGRVQHFTRTMPVNTAAYTRIREYYDWYFVPTNLLWNKFNTFVTQMKDNTQHANSINASRVLADMHPYFTVSQVSTYINAINQSSAKNQFGYNRAQLSVKLLNYLGYGDFKTAQGTATSWYKTNANLNPFPLLAYQKIYSDYYRHSQWETSAAETFNVDYLASDTNSGNNLTLSSIPTQANSALNMFDLRYSNWNKDLFMGLLPNAQYGAASIVDTGSYNGNIQLNLADPTETFVGLSVKPYVGENTEDAQILIGGAGSVAGVNNTKTSSNPYGLQLYLSPSQVGYLRSALGLGTASGTASINTAFSILALRQAEALQKWKEITQSQQQDYKNQIEAHYGVSMSDAYSERCRFIDGSVSNLDISEVTNTNLTGSSAAEIAGKGVGVGQGSFEFTSQVHGYLMCIYHATPLLDYSLTGINRTNLKTKATDYAIPEFDRTGMVSVPLVELTNSSAVTGFASNGLLGYAPRYYEYKQAIDEVHGAFRGSLGSWVAPVSDSYINNFLNGQGNGLTYNWFKVNPSTLNPIFAQDADSSVDTDQLLVNASFDLTAVRNLDRDGLPY